MMPGVMLEELLARALLAADQAEVYAVEYRETPVNFEANRLKHLMTRQGREMALRIVKNGRVGFASGTRTERFSSKAVISVSALKSWESPGVSIAGTARNMITPLPSLT